MAKQYVQVEVKEFAEGKMVMVGNVSQTLADILKADEGLRERVAFYLWKKEYHLSDEFASEFEADKWATPNRMAEFYKQADTIIALISKGE